MGDIAFNISKAQVGYYAGLPGSSDALIIVPIEASGLESDPTLADYDTLAAILAGSNNEQTTMGRQTLTSVTMTVDDTNNRVDISADPASWSAASGNPVGAVVICYDPDTTTGTDSTLVPLSKHDFVATPSGGDLVAQITVALRVS